MEEKRELEEGLEVGSGSSSYEVTMSSERW